MSISTKAFLAAGRPRRNERIEVAGLSAGVVSARPARRVSFQRWEFARAQAAHALARANFFEGRLA